MDTVHIEAEPDDENPEVLQNQDPAFLVSTFLAGKLFLADYGWFLLFGFILLMLLFSWLQPYIAKWMRKREDEAYYSKYEGDNFQNTFEAMQRAREKMQQENDRKTEAFMEQEREREEKKRQQRLEKLEGKSSKLNLGSDTNETGTQPKPKSKSKRLLSSDYLPMGGHQSGGGYRPSRRFTGGG